MAHSRAAKEPALVFFGKEEVVKSETRMGCSGGGSGGDGWPEVTLLSLNLTMLQREEFPSRTEITLVQGH